MTDVMYIVGNDGAGKSTFAMRYCTKARAMRLTVTLFHYHTCLVRRVSRAALEHVAAVSQRKQELTPLTAAPRLEAPARTYVGSRIRSNAIGGCLWIYQFLMALELWLHKWHSGADVVVVERSFVDDLVSAAAALRIDLSESLLKCSAAIFPISRLFYLTADQETEYSRISVVDLSNERHREKDRNYRCAIRVLEKAGVTVRRIDTAPRHETTHER